MLLKELVIDLKQGDAMNQAVDDDGIAPDFREELRQPTAFEQLLRFIQRGAQSVAEAEQPVAGGVAPPGKDLVEIDLAHAGPLGKGGLCDILPRKQPVEHFSCAFTGEMVLVVGEKLMKIGGVHQFLLQIVRVFQLQMIAAFTKGVQFSIIT